MNATPQDFKPPASQVSGPIPSLHVLGSREFGGADQFYVRLIRALDEMGQPVTAINRPGSPVAKALAENPVQQIHLPMSNRWDIWSMLQIRKRIAARNQPCVVQTYMGRATRLTRVPAKSSAVHVARLGGFYKIDGYYRHADAWVGNTRAICDFLVKEGLPAKRVYHIGNFVPDPQPGSADAVADLRRQQDIPEDAWIIFGLGRLIPKKGFSVLLRAIARLPDEIGGRPVVLLVAGDGPSLGELRELTRELGQENRVRWLGWQNPPDPYFAMADVFVCPSKHEPLGNVILEAWNHRVPVVSTRNEGATELIEEGRDGLICERGDDEGMAARIRELLEAAPADRKELADAGYRGLQARYSREAIVGSYLSLYQELLRNQ